MLNLSKPLILGSNSPRRKQLLEELNLPFKVVAKQVGERYPINKLQPEEVPGYLAKIKNNAYKKEKKAGYVVLTADTAVVLGGEILSKPINAKEAKEMLEKLSGRQHLVVTACTLADQTRQIHFSDIAKVFFQKLHQQEIEYYISKYQPFDKAGSYGIQDWIGLIAIKKIDGNFYTVMGLPTHMVYAQLNAFAE